jgi:hypothetical protein
MMTGMRFAFVVALVWVTVAGCSIGAPERASNIQNLNGITDDIWAIGMTRSEAQKVHDPNLPTTIPNNWEVPPD